MDTRLESTIPLQDAAAIRPQIRSQQPLLARLPNTVPAPPIRSLLGSQRTMRVEVFPWLPPTESSQTLRRERK